MNDVIEKTKPMKRTKPPVQQSFTPVAKQTRYGMLMWLRHMCCLLFTSFVQEKRRQMKVKIMRYAVEYLYRGRTIREEVPEDDFVEAFLEQRVIYTHCVFHELN